MNTSELIALWYEELYIKESKFKENNIIVEYITFKKYMTRNDYILEQALESLWEDVYDKSIKQTHIVSPREKDEDSRENP